MTELQWKAPDDGPWELDASHFDAAFARYGVELFVEGFARGQAESFEHVGIPMKGVRAELVNGLPYVQITPLVGKASDAYRKPPPRWLFRLLCAMHPTLRRRLARLREWMGAKGWREDVRWWDEEAKPTLTARFSALEAVALETADDDALLTHLAACGDAVRDNLIAHFRTNPATIYPVGIFLHEVRRWTGDDLGEALTLLHGHGGAEEDLGLAWALAARASGEARALLADTTQPPAAVLDALCDLPAPVGEATRRWRAQVANRQLTSGHLAQPTGAEVPHLLVAQLRNVLARESKPRALPDPARLRARVPEEARDTFDALLAEARHVYRLRDERSSWLDAWAFGLLRRGLLEAGRRLVDRGRLHDREHAVDLDTIELAPMLREGRGPSADEIASRVQARKALRVEDAPAILGATEPPPPPPRQIFEPAMARLIDAIVTYRDLMEKDAPEPERAPHDVLEGLPASGGRYTGVARLCTSPEHFDDVRPGDVLIARATMPAYNVLLPIVGAIVTDRGGALCHAAIVSREYGLPCVVGTRDATSRLRSGDLVTVDGDTGRVELHDAREEACAS